MEKESRLSMIASAKGRFLLLAPRKARSITRILSGINVVKAQAVLEHLAKGACQPVSKILKSAVANATREGTYSQEQLFISRIMTDGGPVLKRFRAGPMGRAMPIRKRMCHVTVELDVKKG